MDRAAIHLQDGRAVPGTQPRGGCVLKIKGILFDKDGTLVDFRATWIPAYRAAARIAAEAAGDERIAERLLRLTGYDPATDTLDPASVLAGGTTAEICDLWARESGAADRIGLVKRLNRAMDHYATVFATPACDALPALFARLKARGLALGIATMDSEAVARATADTLGLTETLDFICGYDSGFGVKPDPGMIIAYCSVNGIEPGEVMMVGDTDRDMAMARAAGAGLAVGVLTGATPRDRLAPICDYVLDSVLVIDMQFDNTFE